MSYDVSFKAKLEGADQWVYVGDDWINHTSNTAAMIKEVCGSYPSEWNGKRCADMYPCSCRARHCCVCIRSATGSLSRATAGARWNPQRNFSGRLRTTAISSRPL